MAKWKYQINGKLLRDAIDNGDEVKVLNEVKRCYQRMERIGVIEDSTYYTDDIDCVIGDYENGDAYPDEVDCVLTDLYDLCDAFRVWITI